MGSFHEDSGEGTAEVGRAHEAAGGRTFSEALAIEKKTVKADMGGWQKDRLGGIGRGGKNENKREGEGRKRRSWRRRCDDNNMKDKKR